MDFIDKIKVGEIEYGISPIIGSGLTKNEESGAINVNVSSGLTIIDNKICIDASFDNDIRDGLKIGFKTLKRVKSNGETLTYFDDMEQIIEVLDTMTGITSSGSSHYEGNFRAFIGGPNADSYVEIKSKVLGYKNNVWMQEIKTHYYLRLIRKNHTDNISTKSQYNFTATTNTAGNKIYQANTNTYRYVHYDQIFDSPSPASSEFNTYYRYSKGYTDENENPKAEFGRWYRKSGPYANNPLENKKLLILGGSFAHNWKGYLSTENITASTSSITYAQQYSAATNQYVSLSGFNFYDEYVKDTNMMDYIANKLNLEGFGNFAQASHGICKRTATQDVKGVPTNDVPYFEFNSVKQLTDARDYAYNVLKVRTETKTSGDDYQYIYNEMDKANIYGKSFKWDAVIVLCGINDYAKQIESGFNGADLIGSPKDSKDLPSSAATYCSGLKEIEWRIKTATYAFNENCQTYFISPYKAIQAPYQNPFAENPAPEGKHTYLEFLETFKNMSTLLSVPYLDLYSKCGINTNTVNRYTRAKGGDTVHPNGYGYYASANVILNFLMNEGTRLTLTDKTKNEMNK